ENEGLINKPETNDHLIEIIMVFNKTKIYIVKPSERPILKILVLEDKGRYELLDSSNIIKNVKKRMNQKYWSLYEILNLMKSLRTKKVKNKISIDCNFTLKRFKTFLKKSKRDISCLSDKT